MRNRINGDRVSIENQNKSVVESINRKISPLPPSPFGVDSCIHRVQEKLRKVNEDAYTPEKVSIGPFHRGKENLKAMENQKLRYVHDILASTNPMEALVDGIRKLEEKSRKCYSEPINLSSNEFVEMMVIDGLFIIELFRKNHYGNLRQSDDPIFNTVWGKAGPMRDLILLENQIPMFVLESLFNQITNPSQVQEHSLQKLALSFFSQLVPQSKEILAESKHLLDLLAKSQEPQLEPEPKESHIESKNLIHPSRENTSSCLLPCVTDLLGAIKNKLEHLLEIKKSNSGSLVHCVTDLHGAGMKFKNSTLLEFKYENGVLKIPHILVQDQTETLLRNLIAFEQSCDESTTFITSYAFLTDSLINSENDVRILRKNGVISHYMGDDEHVSKLFNNLCNEVTLANFCYPHICQKVNAYYDKPWHRWRATLSRDYFYSPWAIISFFGAILLLLLTFLQTFYTIKGTIKGNGDASMPPQLAPMYGD